MLIPLYGRWTVLGTNTDKSRGYDQVVVVIMNVGKHVMDQVVRDLPIIGVGPKEVEDRAQRGVHRGVPGVGTVQGVMANVKSYKRGKHTQYNGHGQHGKRSKAAQQYQ